MRFKVFKIDGLDYKIDKYITRIMFLTILVLFFFVWFSSGAGLFEKNVYLACKGERFCFNPVYQQYDLKGNSNLPDYVFDLETLPEGFELNKPNFLASNFLAIILIIIGVFIFLNHFIHNRSIGFKNLLNDYRKEVKER